MEVVIVMVVAGFILTSSSVFMKTNVESYVMIKNNKESLQSGRIGINRMIAEMNRIVASTDIDWGYGNLIQFDLTNWTNIEYTYSSSEQALMREGVVLVSGVTSFSLLYFNNVGNPIYSFSDKRTDIWSIYVTMIVGDGDQQFEFSSYVHPRNFKYN